MDTIKDEHIMHSRKKIYKKMIRWVLRLLVITIVSPFVLMLLLQVPRIQNYTVDQLSYFLSKNLDAEISVGKVDISISKGFVIEDFLLVDNIQDTIIDSDFVSVSLRKTLLSYFDNEIDLDGITLSKSKVHLIRYADQAQFNLSKILQKLQSEKSGDDPSESIEFNIEEINFDQLTFIYNDMLKGDFYDIEIPSGSIEVKSLQNDIVLDEIKLINPSIKIEKNLGGDLCLIADEDIKIEVAAQLEKETQDTFALTLRLLSIRGGQVWYHDNTVQKNVLQNEIDYAHLELDSLNVDLRSLSYRDNLNVEGQLKNLSFRDQNGFGVSQLSSELIAISKHNIRLENLFLQTDKSVLKDHLEFKFRSFDDFKNLADKVILKVDLEDCAVAYSDLMYLIPGLNKSSFFRKNKNAVIRISGNYRGKINNLSGRNLDISTGRNTRVIGAFSSRNITDPNRALLNLTVQNFSTNFNDLVGIIPGFNPPDNFYKLGRLKYSGRFDGFLNDFVSLGALRTDIGEADLDMRLDLKEGRDKAKYSGQMAVREFDLGKWSDNEDLGLTNFEATVKEGYGLTLDNARADLDALVNTVSYKGYEYKNVLMDGKIDKNNFTGELLVEDEDVNFSFEGGVHVVDGISDVDFSVQINHINLDKLNLAKEISSVSGSMKINARGSELAEIKGESTILDLAIVKNDSLYTMDSIHVASYLVDGANRKVELYTDVASILLKGRFNLTSMVNDTKKIIKTNYPKFAENMRIDAKKQNIQDFVFDINLDSSHRFYELFGINDLALREITVVGEINNEKEVFTAHVEIPFLELANNKVEKSFIDIESLAGKGDLFISLDSTVISGFKTNPININANIADEKINFNIVTDNVTNALEKLDIAGILSPHPKGYEFNISNNEWVMLGNNWSFNKGNKIVVGNEYLEIDDLQLSDGYRFITLSDIDNQGVYVSLNNFNFLKISEIIDYDKMTFEGEGDVELKAKNIYTKPILDLSVSVPEFTVNRDPFGSLKVSLRKNEDTPAKISMSLISDRFQLGVDGSYDDVNDIIDGDLTGRNMPINIMEYIIDTGISSTHGYADLDIILGGTLSDPQFQGDVLFRDCGSTIDYLGVHYTVNNQLLKVTEDYMDFSGIEMQDPEGNIGVIKGGMKHSFLQDFRMEIDMSSQDFIVLNTTRPDNPLYYGFGKGQMEVAFRGPFSVADMTINATTGPRTVLNVPVQNSYFDYEESFIEFINKEDLLDDTGLIAKEFKIEGLDVKMNLSLTNDAEMNIIFNEKLKDIITGRGVGDLQIEIKRSGEFYAYGDYVINRGDYLFTALNVVNKLFKIRKGSTIKWTGDPIDADLNITAEYENIRSSLSVFLAEYLVEASPGVTSEARRNTDVDLSLLIGGSLYQPEINFDLEFPSLQPGELKSYVDTKVRILRANPNLLNDQVPGLILAGTFLPINNPLGNAVLSGSNFLQSGGSTLSEFFSQQFSQVLSGFLNAALPENEFISSVDLEIGLNQNVDILDSANDASVFDFINPDEIQLSLNPRFKFLGERLSARVGGNYVKKSDLITQSAFIPDLTVEYDLTDDGKLKLRFSYIYDFEQQVINNTQSRRQRYGLGLSVRHEFGKVLKVKTGIETAIERAIKNKS